MSYIHLKIGNRLFAIHKGWIELLVYVSTYYGISWFIFNFLVKYSIKDSENEQDNQTAKNSKKKTNTNNKIEIIRGGGDSINNEFLSTILEECFENDASYTLTHPDLVKKIRSFLKVTEAHGIKIVPISVAVIAVLYQNKNFNIMNLAGGATLIVENVPEFKKGIIKSAIKGVIVAGISVVGTVLVATPTGKIVFTLAKRVVLPGVAKTSIAQQEFLKILIGSTLLLAPMKQQIGEAVTSMSLPSSLSSMQRTLNRVFINCEDYVDKLPADPNQQNIKYVQPYQKPDSRIIIQGNSNHIICIPEKQTIKRTLTTFDIVGGKVIIGKKSRVDKKLKTSEFCEVGYKVHKEKITKPQDFENLIDVETLNKAEKMLSDANLLNEDTCNVSPTESPIKIRNN